jgi:anti-sigma B factor antagonist
MKNDLRIRKELKEEMVEGKSQKITILWLEGELVDGENLELVKKDIYSEIREGRVFVIIEVSEIIWISTVGLAVLMNILTLLRGSGGDLKLVGKGKNISRIIRPLEITRLDKVLKIYSSVEEAIKDFLFT